MRPGCVQAGQRVAAGPQGVFVLWGVILGLGTGIPALVLGATVVNPWSFGRKSLVMGLLAGSGATGQFVVLPLATCLIETMVGALRWRHPAATAVRTHFVVVGSPARDLDAGQLHALKPMLFQALVAELAVEAIDMGVLRGLAWLVEDV